MRYDYSVPDKMLFLLLIDFAWEQTTGLQKGGSGLWADRGRAGPRHWNETLPRNSQRKKALNDNPKDKQNKITIVRL